MRSVTPVSYTHLDVYKRQRYYFRWITPDGKRHTEYADTLNELRDKEKEIERRRLLREDSADDTKPIRAKTSTHIKDSDAEQSVEIPKVQITVEPVSYTHLDVYKRQGLHRHCRLLEEAHHPAAKECGSTP